jgi:DNA-binding CsgD family transcriptional regulator/PAS domain-containing protein
VHSEATLLRLIERIYDAALAPERWPEFLEDLATVIDGHVGNIALSNSSFTDPNLSVVVRWDPEAQRLYREHYSALDPWAIEAVRRGLLRTGVVGLGRTVIDRRQLQATEFYNDFGRRFDIRGGISAIIRGDPAVITSLSLSERKGGPRFGRAEVQLFRRLMPHLQRAFQVHERLGAAAQARAAAEGVIDKMPFGVILLDANARPVMINRSAHEILNRRDGLMLHGTILTASTVQQSAELRKAIAQTLLIGRGGLPELSGGALVIRRPSLKRPLQVFVTPIGRGAGRLTLSIAGPVAAVFVSDPESEPATPATMLRTFYGLTPAETRLASELLQQRTVEEAAGILGISLNTARTQVKRLFEKTGTRRQSELVQVLGRGIGRIRP